MKKNLLLVMLALVLVLASCAGDSGTDDTSDPGTGTETRLPDTAAPDTEDTSETHDTVETSGRIELEGISFTESEISLRAGQASVPEIVFDPGDTPYRELVWTSSDENVARYSDREGIVAVGEGECDITAASVSREDITASVHVTVVRGEDNMVERISLDKYEVNLTVGLTDMPWVTMYPENASDKREIWVSDNTSVAAVNSYGLITGVSEGTCTVTVRSAGNESVYAEVTVNVSAPKVFTEVTYVDGILIANKTYGLPSDYNPGIDPDAQSALDSMISGAASEGISLWVVSGFRSYGTQQTLYNNYVARDGQGAADRYSARPGHSEHQTGLAFDLNSLEQYFGETAEGKWLAAHCWEYGFIIRYPQGKEGITGYMYEPWHVRYLGTEVAERVYNSGLTLEEYLGITSVY